MDILFDDGGLKMTVHPGFSGTVLSFNDVSQKKNHSSPGAPIFGLVSRISPDLQPYTYASVAKN